MSEALSGAAVLQKIEEKDVDLQSFGLESPALTVAFSDGDGQQYQLSFGNYMRMRRKPAAMGCSQVVRHGTLTPAFAGSSPATPAF